MHTTATIAQADAWQALAAKLVAAQTLATKTSSQQQSKQTAGAIARKLVLLATYK